MIPATRPVNGYDLLALREKLGLSTADFCWFFHLSMPKWTEMTSVKVASGDDIPAEKPVNDPALAFLVRWLDRHPDDLPMKENLTPQEFVQALKKHKVKVDRREVAVGLGREASAAYRWASQRGRRPAAAAILSHVFLLLLSVMERRKKAEGQGAGEATWEEWRQIVEIEARARQVPGSLWTEGLWRQSPVVMAARGMKPAPKKRRKRRAAAQRPRLDME
jgi:hypothetical protein